MRRPRMRYNNNGSVYKLRKQGYLIQIMPAVDYKTVEQTRITSNRSTITCLSMKLKWS